MLGVGVKKSLSEILATDVHRGMLEIYLRKCVLVHAHRFDSFAGAKKDERPQQAYTHSRRVLKKTRRHIFGLQRNKATK